MDQRRNPYLILGIDHGEGPAAASAAFAAAVRRARRGEHSHSIEDLTWALHRIEHQGEESAADLATFRVPADPTVYPTHPDNLQIVPRDTGDIIDRDEAVALVGGLAKEQAVRESLIEASRPLLAVGVVEEASEQARSRPTFKAPKGPSGTPPPPPPADGVRRPSAVTPQTARPAALSVAAVVILMLVTGVALWAALTDLSSGPDIVASPAPSNDGLEPAPAHDEEVATEVGPRIAAADLDPWNRVPHDDAIFGGAGLQSMVSIAAGGPGLVAVGFDTGTGAAAAWTSVDGAAWQRVEHDETTFGGGGQQEMLSVAAGGPGLVAVGRDAGLTAAAVWTSTDGLAWNRVQEHGDIFAGWRNHQMAGVVAGGPGFVAVGRDTYSAAVWTSTDGFRWERVPHDDSVFGRNGSHGMEAVAAGGPGLVAVGRDEERNAAAVWVSEDGDTWTRVRHSESVFGGVGHQSMEAVSVGGPGLVAVGHDRGDAAAWVSEDGLDWQRAELLGSENTETGSGLMNSVAVGGPGLVAVGRDENLNAAAVWVSEDGLLWQRVLPLPMTGDGPLGKSMGAVTAGGPGLVAVGHADGIGSAAVWHQGGDVGPELVPAQDEVRRIDLETLRPQQLITREAGCLDVRDADLWRDVSGERGSFAWEFVEDPVDPHPDSNMLVYYVELLHIADLTGDGHEEAVIAAWCSSGAGGSPRELVVFTAGPNGPEFLEVLHAGIGGAVYGDVLADVTIRDGRVESVQGIYGHEMGPETVSVVSVAFSWDQATQSFTYEQLSDPRLVELQSFLDVRRAPGWPGTTVADLREVPAASNSDLVDVLEQYVRALDVGDYLGAHDLLAPELVSRPGWSSARYVSFWRDHLVGADLLDVVEIDATAQEITARIDFLVVGNDASRELIEFGFRRTSNGRILIADYQVIQSDWRSNAW